MIRSSIFIGKSDPQRAISARLLVIVYHSVGNVVVADHDEQLLCARDRRVQPAALVLEQRAAL